MKKKLTIAQHRALRALHWGGWVRPGTGQGNAFCALVDKGLAERDVIPRNSPGWNRNGAVIFRATNRLQAQVDWTVRLDKEGTS